MFLHRFGKIFNDFWAVLGWICNCETIVDSVKDSSEHLINTSLCTFDDGDGGDDGNGADDDDNDDDDDDDDQSPRVDPYLFLAPK